MQSRNLITRQERRRGVAALDYILVLGVILPLAAIVIPYSIRITRSLFDFLSVMVTWPFM